MSCKPAVWVTWPFQTGHKPLTRSTARLPVLTGLPAAAPTAESQLQSSAAPSPAYPKVHWSRLTGLWDPKAQSESLSKIRSRLVLHAPTPSKLLRPSSHPSTITAGRTPLSRMMATCPGWFGPRKGRRACVSFKYCPLPLQARGRIITGIKLKQKQIYDNQKFLTRYHRICDCYNNW